MTAMVSARALWRPSETSTWPAQMFSCSIDGWDYISDRFILLPVARLGELPIGYGDLLVPLPPQAEAQFAEWLNSTVVPAPSDRMFERCIIDPLEAAGFLLRPLVGVRNAHGICDPDLKLVGLAIPVHAAVTSGETARKAANLDNDAAEKVCERCGGRGYYFELGGDPCPVCRTTGRVPADG